MKKLLLFALVGALVPIANAVDGTWTKLKTDGSKEYTIWTWDDSKWSKDRKEIKFEGDNFKILEPKYKDRVIFMKSPYIVLEPKYKDRVIFMESPYKVLEPKYKDKVIFTSNGLRVPTFKQLYPGSKTWIVTYAGKDSAAENVLCGTCGGNKACKGCEFE